MNAAACATLISPSTMLCRKHCSAYEAALSKASGYSWQHASILKLLLYTALWSSLASASALTTPDRHKNKLKCAEYDDTSGNGSLYKLTCLRQLDEVLLDMFGFWLVKPVA